MNLKSNLLFPLGTILLIVILSVTLLRTSISGIFNFREENKAQEEKILNLKKKSEKLISLDEQELISKVEKVEQILPSKQPLIALISQISALSQEEGVKFTGLELDPQKLKNQINVVSQDQKEEEKTESLPLLIKINGETAKVFSFIRRLDEIPPLMKIESFSLETGGEKMIELTIRIFYQELPQTLGKIDAPLPELNEKAQEILNNFSEFKIFPALPEDAPVGKENPFAQ